MNITPDQLKNLKWLHERGGVGYLDQYGRVNAMGEAAPRGSWIAWLNLVASGLINGGMRRLNISTAGRQFLAPNDCECRAGECESNPNRRFRMEAEICEGGHQ